MFFCSSLSLKSSSKRTEVCLSIKQRQTSTCHEANLEGEEKLQVSPNDSARTEAGEVHCPSPPHSTHTRGHGGPQGSDPMWLRGWACWDSAVAGPQGGSSGQGWAPRRYSGKSQFLTSRPGALSTGIRNNGFFLPFQKMVNLNLS